MINEIELARLVKRIRIYWERQYAMQRTEYIQGIVAGCRQIETEVIQIIEKNRRIREEHLAIERAWSAKRLYHIIRTAVSYIRTGNKKRAFALLSKVEVRPKG